MPIPDHYSFLHQNFFWKVPQRFNVAQACCGRWAASSRTASQTAVIVEQESGRIDRYSYGVLQSQANRLSNALKRLGVKRGDRVAIVMPQRFETAVAHMAITQMAAVAMPMSMLFGVEALEFRLRDSGARIVLADEHAMANVLAARALVPGVVVIGVGRAQPDGDYGYRQLLDKSSASFSPLATRADEPAFFLYTSGTTGPPKGALIPHRALIGNLPGFVASQNWFPLNARVFWSPADWAWTGGLMDALLPTLYFGKPILAFTGRFSPQRAFELMQSHAVSHSFLFPTALKAMMKAYPDPKRHFELGLQAIMSAGESVGDAVYDYCESRLGVVVNEMFGQTEVNYIVGNGAMNHLGHPQVGWPAKRGSMGRPYPGHRVEVIDEEGRVLPRGEVGEVAIHRRDRHGVLDPIFFLGYWNNPRATEAKFSNHDLQSWCRTGDMALMDADGYLIYQGRTDDVFKTSGYRVGPGEIENCLVKHPAVANAAVIPKPDAERGAVVKAFVVVAAGHTASAALIDELQAFVRKRLAPYQYPKEIEFIDALPMTTTGKIQRNVLRARQQTSESGSKLNG
ncbi:MAG: AMP-binding protein [Betaproteobacteria bacterium]|jgi:acetyl-CoA synthetase|nr:AMP-binding protein [Betaproteobacteria bacterium]